jgi:hypothetical protein
MTDHRDDHADGADGADAELLHQLSAALTEAGELVPTDEAEVMRAEEDGAEQVELPAELATFRPRAEDDREEEPARSEHRQAPADLAAYRAKRQRSVLSHLSAVALGAAAAAALVLLWKGQDPPEAPLGGDPAGVVPSASGSGAPDLGPLTLSASCEGCCGGSACSKPRSGLESCPSGRACLSCDSAALADSLYRLRIGAVHLAEHGIETLKLYPTGQAEVCLRAGLSDEVCVDSSLVKERDGGRWNTLPVVVSGDDLAAKLSIRVRWKGVQRESLATAARWTAPVALTPHSLCNGYVVELIAEKEDRFGSMSLFIDDAHYVELMRAGESAPLRDYRKRLQLEGVRVQLQQVQGQGFVLAAGPFDRRTAEQLRWQLIEQKQPAKVTVGTDFIGPPLPLP